MKARWYLFDSKDCDEENTLSFGEKSDLIFDIPLIKQHSENMFNEETL